MNTQPNQRLSSQAAMSAIFAPVAGLTVSKVRPSAASRNRPSMKACERMRSPAASVFQSAGVLSDSGLVMMFPMTRPAVAAGAWRAAQMPARRRWTSSLLSRRPNERRMTPTIAR